MNRRTDQEIEADLLARAAKVAERRRRREAKAEKSWRTTVLNVEAGMRQHLGCVPPEFAADFEAAHGLVSAMASRIVS